MGKIKISTENCKRGVEINFKNILQLCYLVFIAINLNYKTYGNLNFGFS